MHMSHYMHDCGDREVDRPGAREAQGGRDQKEGTRATRGDQKEGTMYYITIYHITFYVLGALY